jgi:hypothetical protein
MSIRIEPYTESLGPAVRSFNARLVQHGVAPEFVIKEGAAPLSKRPLPRPIVETCQFVAVEDGTVRGGFMLQEQPFWLDGAVRSVANYQMPVSEGIVDRRYAHLGMFMLKYALHRSPLLFGVGMGGFDRPLPRMLKMLGWEVREVPFLFRVHHPGRFLEEIRALRSNALLRAVADVARMTGAGSLGIRLVQSRWWMRPLVPLQVEALDAWGGWADELWEGTKDSHSMAALRSRATLTLLYPPSDPRYLCYRMRRDARIVGWMVLLNTAMRGQKYFGDLRVGTVLDCLALPGYVDAVAWTATRQLEDLGVDILITNQAHHLWVRGFRRAGFLTAPSEYLLGTSKPLTDLLEPFAQKQHDIHVTRGDSDGRINLC